MAIKTISQFESAAPAANDVILFEQNGEGKSTSIQNLILNTVYPVGSIYLSLQDISPSSFIGGSSWEKLPEGKALWTASSGLSITDNSVNNIDAGLPNINGKFTAYAYIDGLPENAFFSDITNPDVLNSGSSNNMNYVYFYFNADKGATVKGIYRDDCKTVQPPAYKVYAWKRIA